MIKYIITQPISSNYYKIYINCVRDENRLNTKLYDNTKEAALDLINITGGTECKILIK